MRCNPARWLWGLIPIAMLSWITYHWERPGIEADLARRATLSLEKAGAGWARVEFQGRDAVLTGHAPKDGQAKVAHETVLSVWGVRLSTLRTDLAKDTGPYGWSAAYAGKRLKLTGLAPDAETRAAIGELARKAFPKTTIESTIKIAAGGPGARTWLDEIDFALTQLAGLSNGRVEIVGTSLSVEGEASAAASFKAIERAVAGRLPKGLKSARSTVLLPRASPFLWSARLGDGQLLLSGYVPSEAVQAVLFAQARRSFAKLAIVDHTEPAAGAPYDFAASARTGLELLARLRDGEAKVRAGDLTLEGTAVSEEIARSVRTSLESAGLSVRQPPGAIKVAATEVTATITEGGVSASKPGPPGSQEPSAAEPSPSRPGTLRTIVDAVGGTAGFGGLVASEAARHAAGQTEIERSMQAYAASRRDAEMRAQGNSLDGARQATDAARRTAVEIEMKARREAYAAARKVAESKGPTEAAPAPRRPVTAAERKAEAENCQKRLTDVAETGVILFDWASADLDPKSTSTLDKLAQIAKGCPGSRIAIEGHTDAEGEPDRNLKLSQRRAGAVLAYLSKAGVEPARLQAVGYGAERPRAPNDTARNRAKNRRIEFSVVPEE